MVRRVALAVLLLGGGCLIVNPAFTPDGETTRDGPTGDAPTTGDATTDTATSPTTGGDPTTGAWATSGEVTTGDPVTSDATVEMPPEGLPGCDADDVALVACYDFEPDPNDPSRLVDGSQFGNDGVQAGVSVVAGVVGQGVEILDATELVVPDDQTLGADAALSLSVWVRLAAAPPAGQRVGVLDKDAQWGLFIHDVDGLACTVAGAKASAAQPFPTRKWTHVGCVFDGRRLRLYLDGQPIADVPGGGAIGPNVAPLLLGCDSPGCDERMVGGNLDAVRIWNVAVPDDVICAHANGC